MKRFLLPLVLPLFVISAASAGTASISWKKGYAAASAVAKSSGKLIMIDFYTDWCGWCKKLDADSYPAPEVVKQSEHFVPIKLNAEKDSDGIRLAKKFAVNGFPTILFLDSNEKLVYKIVGYSPPKELAVSMGKAATIRQETAKYKSALRANPKDFDGLVGMASVDASMGNTDEAANHIAAAAKSTPRAKIGKLLDAFNAVGDGYQNSEKYAKAITYFKQAIAPGFDSQAAYARISIAVCYSSMGKLSDAKPYVQALLKMDHLSKEFTDQAKSMLDAINKSGK